MTAELNANASRIKDLEGQLVRRTQELQRTKALALDPSPSKSAKATAEVRV